MAANLVHLIYNLIAHFYLPGGMIRKSEPVMQIPPFGRQLSLPCDDRLAIPSHSPVLRARSIQ